MATVDLTRIAGNISALNALNSLTYINSQLAVRQTRLATGKRINEAADDPAGNSLATTFDVRKEGLKTVLKSLGDAKNLMANMEGGLKKVQDILVKMRNKALEAKGDVVGSSERASIQAQLRDYALEIDDIVKQTQWNGTTLLSGANGSGNSIPKNFLTGPEAVGGTNAFSFTSGIAMGTNQGFQARTATLTNAGLGLDDTALTVTNTTSAGSAADRIDKALAVVKEGVSQIGSFTARLSFKEEALTVQYTNTEAAFNRIMNANMAEEQVEASKYTILQQTATAMLAQANQAPQFLLSLFK